MITRKEVLAAVTASFAIHMLLFGNTEVTKAYSAEENDYYASEEKDAELVASVTAAATEFTVDALDTSETMYSTTSLNVRSGPGTGYSVVSSLYRGQSVTVVGKTSNGWMKLSDGNYCSGKYLSYTKPSSTSSTSNTARTITKYGGSTSGHVHNYVRCMCSCGQIEYMDEDDQTVILNYSMCKELGLLNQENVVVPDTYYKDGVAYTVVGVGNMVYWGSGVFENNTTIRTVTLPDTITYIGEYTFNKCSNLQSINLPSGLKYIGKAAFQLCTSLSWITIPDSVEYIGDFAFNHCTGAMNDVIVLPSNLVSIGEYQNYPAHAFYDCGKDGVFKAFVISDANQYYKTVDGILYTKDGSTLISIPRGKVFENGVYEMPDTILNLGELAFSRNTSVNTVIISDNLVVDGDMNSYEKSQYINYGNDLSISCYGYAPVTRYEVKSTNTRYKSVDGVLYSKDGTTVVAIPNNYTGALNIAEGTTTWSYQAMWADAISYFKGVSLNKITSINIPSTMTNIDDGQLTGINQLVDVYGTIVTVTSGNVSYYVDGSGHLVHY